MRLRILHKLLIVFILIASLPILVAGFRIIQIAQTTQETNILEKHTEKAKEVSSLVDFYIGKWQDAMIVIANSQEKETLDTAEFQSLLTALVESYEDIILLQVTFYDGSSNSVIKEKVYAEMQDNLEPYLKLLDKVEEPTQQAQQQKEIILSDVIVIKELKKSFLVIAVPIQRQLVGVGALVGIIDLSTLQDAIVERSQMGDDTVREQVAYVVNQRGELLFHPEKERVLESENVSELGIVSKVLRSQVGAIITETFEHNEVMMLGAATFATKIPWAVVVEEPAEDAYFSVAQMRFNFWSWLLVGIGVAVVLAFLFAEIFNRPILKLASAARSVATGDFNQSVDIQNKDELGELASVFNEMTAELRRYDEINVNKLISEQAKIQAIIRNIADGVIATDTQKKILFLNNQAEQWFGVSNEHAQGHILIDSVKNDKLDILISNTLSQTTETITEITDDNIAEINIVDAQTMENRVLKAITAPVIDGKSEIIGIVTALRDITREKEIDRMKSEIVSVVSHELRTPLTSIQGFSQFLMDEDLPPDERKNYAEIVISEADRLTNMINEFLDLSRLESGRMEIHKAPFNLIDTLMNTVFVISTQAGQKDIAIYPDFYTDDVYVNADMDTIGQVMMNLLSNAVKYSPPSREVTVKVEDEDKNVRVSVVDQGFGMKQSDADQVFDKFFRVKSDETREITGTGLGLPIVKEIIDRHEQTIKVTSAIGKGTTFSFTLEKADLDALDEMDIE